ncbi:MAG: hypothetical protein ACLTDV_07205 [Eubacterium sp.]
MHQRDIERFAFLFLCGKRDRAILLGKEKMTFSDLDRLTYVTDFLGLKLYNLEIWNEYAGQFSEQFRQLELLYDETCGVVSWDPTEADEHLHDKWLQEFCTQVCGSGNAETAGTNYKQQYREKVDIGPTETGIV